MANNTNSPTTPAISVIVPVYNQERYLEKCLDSLRSQSFKNFETILVNDGSSDNSLSIMISYSKLFTTPVRIINKPNGGVASARNAGVSASSGKYLIHVDPDDWVEPNYLSELYHCAKENNADMVICDYYEEYSGETKIVNHDGLDECSIKDLKLSLVNGKIWGTCWNKLIRRETIGQELCFEPFIDFQEDKLFIYRVLNKMGGYFLHS